MRSHTLASRALVVLLVLVAAALALRGTALAQQAPQLTASLVRELPTDPESPIWQQARPAAVPLTPQVVALPRLAQVSVQSVSVRALHDGQRIAFLMAWSDPTRDARAVKPDEFRDAAAIMLPVGDAPPNICMGSPGQTTNLWHWKADWQEDIDKGFQDLPQAYPNFSKDYYPYAAGSPPFDAAKDFASDEAKAYLIGRAAGNPLSAVTKKSPVEELLAVGFGTTTHKQRQEVEGRGVWSGGRWQVAFVRALASGDAAEADLAKRSDVPVAFAVWNGANQEVGARKQVSGFLTLRIAGEAAPPAAPPAAAPAVPTRVPLAYEWWISIAVALIILVLGGAALAGYWARQREIARRQERE
ncbi:MAG: hypothetical protein HY691_01610 [Chloroflexi bacterium]|nr:hypothetical protein [Chloroflexota bacterium]